MCRCLAKRVFPCQARLPLPSSVNLLASGSGVRLLQRLDARAWELAIDCDHPKYDGGRDTYGPSSAVSSSSVS